jgi:transcriptional regulator of arginine metabolism
MARDALFDQLLTSWIRAHDVREQKEIHGFLESKGYSLSQATLSRHLKRLTISKVLGTYQVIKENTPFLASVVDIHISDYGMIVLHTHPGQAGMVAHFLDQRYGKKEKPNTSGILGTLAGDDTVLVIVKNKEKMTDAVAVLDKEFPYVRRE